MSEAAKSIGIGPSITFKGKSYSLKPWTLEMTCLFESFLEQRAWDAVERQRGTCTETQFQERLNSVPAMIASGKFSEGSQAYADAAVSLPGMKFGVFLQLKAENPEVSEKLVQEMFSEIGEELWAKVTEANKDPFVGPAAGETPRPSENSSPSSPENPGDSCPSKPEN
jgi:hypothetical protein